MTAALSFAPAVWTPATVKAARPKDAAKKYGTEDPGEVSESAPGLAVACSTSQLANDSARHIAPVERLKVWQVVHIASGYVIGFRRVSRHAARLAAIELATVTDWTRSIAEIRSDPDAIERAKEVVKTINRGWK